MLDLYFKYRGVLRRLRSGALGEEMDRIAAHFFAIGYKRGSAKLYISRLARFSDFVNRNSRTARIDQTIIDRFVQSLPSASPRIAARTAIEHARRIAPERFYIPCPAMSDPHGPFLAAFLDHLRRVQGLAPKTCEGLLVTARRILVWHSDQMPDQPLAAMTGEHVLALVEHLLSLSTNGYTRTSTTSYARTFLRFLRWSDLNSRTKTGRDRLVPLLQEAGEALADYVLHARPKIDSQRVFLSYAPPVGPFKSSSPISRIVRSRLERAGIKLSRVSGAHLVRHSLATQLVKQRRPINEVADLLGHRSIDTTAIYVKVALPQLADVALPFPGGAK
jgi:hypothetical protein